MMQNQEEEIPSNITNKLAASVKYTRDLPIRQYVSLDNWGIVCQKDHHDIR